ncbi:UbiA family prenyltransferase [Kitasatospora sp. NPDC006697]|uniref:UbiA family prenyltransferase n=1 Tax=Kitasatospora sp. NPDC006697 TaxID=3364020 RepID=UPI0036CAE92F
MHTTGSQQACEAAAVASPPSAGGPVRGLLAASHAAPSIAVTVVITALAAASGRSVAGSALVASAVLTGQLSVGWCNDRVDLRRDLATGRSDKPLATGAVRPQTVAVAAGCALALCIPLSLANGLAAGTAHLVGVAAAWSYNLGVKRTVFSWLPYAVAFGLLPAFVTLALPGHPWPAGWAVVAGALLGTGAHATNVLPDIDGDLRTGVRGLPQRLGPLGARFLAAGLLLAGAVVLILGPSGRIGTVGWVSLAVTGALALAVALPTGSDPQSRLPFLATVALAALDVGLLLLRVAALT